jgi:5'-3' exonuclease
MTTHWLVLDVTYLGHRAFHTTGGMRFGAVGTGVVYGILRTANTLMDRFGTSDVVWCFDHGPNKRKEIFPGYKVKRNQHLNESQKEAMADMRRQTLELRTKHLPRLGCGNVFYQDGYEADDVMASVVNNLGKKDRVTVVTGDSDLYQLLHPTASVFHPREDKLVTYKEFLVEYGITPWHWPLVKSIAGGHDNLPGVKGVGVKTAVKFVALGLGYSSRLTPAMAKWCRSPEYSLNVSLSRLPLPGCKDFVPKKDKIDSKVWRKLCDELGMKSLKRNVPGHRKGLGL